MKIFISGGCKNGKSTYAEKIAVALSKNAKPLYYIATMQPVDNEDDLRIERHIQNRKGLGFNTLECHKDISKLITHYNITGTFLLDSLTALLANEMFLQNDHIDVKAHLKIVDELTCLLGSPNNIVLVSDYIYSDSMVYDEYTEIYRRSLAYIDCHCAALCDVVIEVCYSNLVFFKGKELLEEFYESHI